MRLNRGFCYYLTWIRDAELDVGLFISGKKSTSSSIPKSANKKAANNPKIIHRFKYILYP